MQGKNMKHKQRGSFGKVPVQVNRNPELKKHADTIYNWVSVSCHQEVNLLDCFLFFFVPYGRFVSSDLKHL